VRALALLRALRPDAWTLLTRLLGSDVSTAVTTFLAALVLVRRGTLELRQGEAYSRVEVRRTAVGANRVSELDDWT